MNNAELALIGVIATAVLGWLGTRYAARSSTEAQRLSVVGEVKAVDAAAYERARASYEAAIANYQREEQRASARALTLAEELGTLRRDRDAKQERIYQLEREHARCMQHSVECRERMDRLRHRLAQGDVLSPDDPDLRVDF